jgi:hypothetical protein
MPHANFPTFHLTKHSSSSIYADRGSPKVRARCDALARAVSDGGRTASPALRGGRRGSGKARARAGAPVGADRGARELEVFSLGERQLPARAAGRFLLMRKTPIVGSSPTRGVEKKPRLQGFLITAVAWPDKATSRVHISANAGLRSRTYEATRRNRRPRRGDPWIGSHANDRAPCYRGYGGSKRETRSRRCSSARVVGHIPGWLRIWAYEAENQLPHRRGHGITVTRCGFPGWLICALWRLESTLPSPHFDPPPCSPSVTSLWPVRGGGTLPQSSA